MLPDIDLVIVSYMSKELKRHTVKQHKHASKFADKIHILAGQ